MSIIRFDPFRDRPTGRLVPVRDPLCCCLQRIPGVGGKLQDELGCWGWLSKRVGLSCPQMKSVRISLGPSRGPQRGGQVVDLGVGAGRMWRVLAGSGC